MDSPIGMPILMQLAASGLSDAARSSQLGSLSRLRMMGLERAMMYSVLHRSFSRISHSSLHRSRGLSIPELRSHVGKAKWQRDGMANWEQRSDRWLDVPIMVKAAGEEGKRKESEIFSYSRDSFSTQHISGCIHIWRALDVGLAQAPRTIRNANRSQVTAEVEPMCTLYCDLAPWPPEHSPWPH